MRAALPVLAAVLAGCSAAGGGLSADAALSHADWLEVDLASGAVAAVPAPDARDLAGERWRTGHALFRRIPASRVQPGGQLLPGGGEPEDGVALASDGCSFLAVFELSEAQWAAIAGGGGGDGSRPLANVPASTVAAAVAALRLERLRLALPDPGLWAVGCAAGSAGLFCWGDGTAADAAGTYAVHHHQGDAPPAGPAIPGSLLPNALGLHDMHGNLWELVRRGDGAFAVRGGAWDTPVLQCRTANELAIPADLALPAVGVRLALVP